MLALRINVDINFLNVIWSVSIVFFTTSIILCAFMTIRRIKRNKYKDQIRKEEQSLDTYISEAIRTRMSPKLVIEDMPTRSASVMSKVFLHYFRTLTGCEVEHLQSIICETSLEQTISTATSKGVLGSRMRALKVLSYLPSQSSLPIIFQHLSSDVKYVRLTSARGLVRRKALYWFDPIIVSCSEAFPDDVGLLASILKGFGSEAIEPLEKRILSSENDMITAACLETLVALMPAHSSLNLTELAMHMDKRVRAGAVSLSAVSLHEGKVDPIRFCLKDGSVMVKIRAAKIAHDSKRVDTVSELFALIQDPVFWVRYWALKAIWQSGKSGQKLVTSVSENNQMAHNVVLELKSGYV